MVLCCLFFFPKTENYHFPFFFFQFDKRNQISGGGVEFVFGGHGFVVSFGFFFSEIIFLFLLSRCSYLLLTYFKHTEKE